MYDQKNKINMHSNWIIPDNLADIFYSLNKVLAISIAKLMTCWKQNICHYFLDSNINFNMSN